MPKLPEHLKAFGEKYRLKPDDVWNCHGTWVAYHKAIERIAAEQGVQFDPPVALEAKTPTVAVLVTARFGEKSEWSIGEAAPNNCKNAYPWAMAEKRAKDRAALKVLGLHGLYSEEEADDFKEAAPKVPLSGTNPVGPLDNNGMSNRELKQMFDTLHGQMKECASVAALDDWGRETADEINQLPEDYRESLRGDFRRYREELKMRNAA